MNLAAGALYKHSQQRINPGTYIIKATAVSTKTFQSHLLLPAPSEQSWAEVWRKLFAVCRNQRGDFSLAGVCIRVLS
ncbi:hypothetical protein BH11BAC4_BH11BAC4_19860 [soil metagenome]